MTNDASRRLAQIAALLSDYGPSPDERSAVRAMVALLSSDAPEMSLSSVRYLPGHFTASAFVTDPAVERVLLIHHGKLDIWVQPGGHIEPADPSVLDAAIREVTEETGVVGLDAGTGELFDVDVHPIPLRHDPLRGDTPAHRHYDVRFHLVTECEAVHVTDEVKAVRWTALDDVPLLTTDPSVMRPVGKLRHRTAARS